ncbi:TPA: hypothetical protein QEL15_001954 [Stenotrophomonas maltophilia]|nr:hypothetical protein [Stenotrophomonas maltophilia]
MANYFYYAALMFLVIKLASTYLILNVNDPTKLLETSSKRVIYWISKLSPSLCVMSLMIWAFIQGKTLLAIGYGLILLVLIPVTFAVLRARQRGTWFGLVHMLRRK